MPIRVYVSQMVGLLSEVMIPMRDHVSDLGLPAACF